MMSDSKIRDIQLLALINFLVGRVMTFKIHYTINDYEDSYFISGKNIEEIWEKNDKEMEKRNLNDHENDMWSEKQEGKDG